MDYHVEQGDIIELETNRSLVLILSKNFFNKTGLSIVCPVVKKAAEDALHIPVQSDAVQGTALCEQLKTMDLERRHFRKTGSISYVQIQEITDAVQSIFDYYPYG